MQLMPLSPARALRKGVVTKAALAQLAGLLMAALLLASDPAAAAPQVGETIFARGAASASRDGEVLLLGNGTPIQEGDVLTTGERSFVLVRFQDGTRLTLRPNTVFQVEQYAHGAGQESALMRLFKGGLRAVTGLLSTRNANGFRLRTPSATIGIRGTDFTARLCAEDCLREAANYARPVYGPPPATVGRVAFVRGPLTARLGDGSERRLVTGAAFYEGDLLETAPQTVAVLAFRDEGRVTLQPGTQFRIDRYSFDTKAPSTGSSLFSLLRGGLRAVTGLLARGAPDRYRIKTPIATIGVRGTAFDLVCQDDCARTGSASAQPQDPMARALAALLLAVVPNAVAQPPPGSGLFILPRIGTVIVTPLGSTTALTLGPRQNVFIPGDLGRHVLGPQIPRQILEQLRAVPSPDTVTLPPGLFAVAAQNEPQPGLYLSVIDEGHLTVDAAGTQLDIGKGEGLYVGEQVVTRLEGGSPPFVRQDPFNAIDPRINPGTTPVPDPEQSPMECRI